MWISIFYDARTGKCEQITSSDGFARQDIINYIDNYCPPEKRAVNGKDSLRIKRVDNEEMIDLLKGKIPARIPTVRGGIAILRSDSTGKIVNNSDYRQKW